MPIDEELAGILKGAAARLARSRWSGDKEARDLEVHELFRLFEDGGVACFAAVFSFPPENTRHFAPFLSAPELSEAETDPRFLDFAAGAIRSGREIPGRSSTLRWEGTPVPSGKVLKIERLGGDTTNAVVKFDLGRAAVVFKSYRAVDEFNPEPELLSFLSSKGSKTTPRVLGSVSLVPEGTAGRGARRTVLGLLTGFSTGVPAFPAFVGNARRSMARGLPPHDCIPGRLGIALGDLNPYAAWLAATRNRPYRLCRAIS